MASSAKLWWVSLAAVAVIGGIVPACGSDEGSTTDGSGGTGGACVPGEQSVCPCPGGGNGVQICEASGAFGACTGCGSECNQPECFARCTCEGKDPQACLAECANSGGAGGGAGTAGAAGTGGAAGSAGSAGSSGSSGSGAFGGSSGSGQGGSGQGGSGQGGFGGSGFGGSGQGGSGQGGSGGAACDDCVVQNCSSELQACQADAGCQECLACIQQNGGVFSCPQCQGANGFVPLATCSIGASCPCQ